MNQRQNAGANTLLGSILFLSGLLVLLVVALAGDSGMMDSRRMTALGMLSVVLIATGLLLILLRDRIEFLNLILLGGVMVVCLLFAEAFLRITDKEQLEFKIAMENPYGTGSYRLMPNLDFTYNYHGDQVAIKTNSAGMRWREVDLAKPGGVERVAFVGDSFTFGESADRIENCFVGVFDSEQENNRFETLNFGMVGYGLADIELQVEEEILQFDPDYLILTFFNGNDVRDTYLGVDKYDISSGLLMWNREVCDSKVPEEFRRKDNDNSPDQQGDSPLNKLYLFRRIEGALSALKKGVLQGTNGARTDHELLRDFTVSNEFTSFTFWSREKYPDVAYDAVEETLASLDNILETAEENDIELAVISIPSEEQVYADLERGVDANGTAYDISLPQKYIEEWSESNSVPYLDLLPFLRLYVMENNLILYPENDVHFNNEGHHVVGSLVSEFFGEEVSNE